MTGYIETPIQRQEGQPMFRTFLYECGDPENIGFSCATFHDKKWREYQTTGVKRSNIDGMVQQVMFYVNQRAGTSLVNGFPKDVEMMLWLSETRTALAPELFNQVKEKLAEPEKQGLVKIL